MKQIFIDYETYYDKDYSLKKMTTIEYLLDPRFELIGAAVQEGVNGESRWLEGEAAVRAYLKGKEDCCFVCHKGTFDFQLMAHRLQFVPKLMICTLSMARAMLYAYTGSVSLETVALHLGLGVKGTAIKAAAGQGLAALKASGEYLEYVAYAHNDVQLCAKIFVELMRRGFPPGELFIIDMVLRAAVQPRFRLDPTVLAEHLYEVQQRKQEQMDKIQGLGASKADLMSNEKFAEVLRGFGVEPPTKVSAITKQTTYAFAKSDRAFADLLEHEDDRVQALVAARLGHKSTLDETRTQSFQRIAMLNWPTSGVTGTLPIPLRYSGAHTHRLSGEDGINLQNLPRKGKLRRALIAPPGWKVLTVDAAQIEARVVVWLNKAFKLLNAFANGEDVYAVFASQVFGRLITKANDPDERFVGKQAVLGLGFGMGAPKFKLQLAKDSRLQTGKTIDLSDYEAQRIVNVYRQDMAKEVAQGWAFLESMLYKMASGVGVPFQWGPVVFEHQRILLPNGLYLHYKDLARVNGQWTYKFGRETKYLFGGKLMENIVQALARICTMDAGARIQKIIRTFDLHMNLQVHDELGYVVPDEFVNVMRKIMADEVRRRPTWAPDLPLDCDPPGVGQCYGDAK